MIYINKTGLAILTVLFTLIFTSCEQSELIGFDETYDGIAFYINGDGSQADSLAYSFAYNTEQLTTDTIFIKMRLVGKLKDTDRAIKVIADEGTTATAGVHYKLPDIVLQSGKGYVDYPLVLYNTADLKTNDYKIKLKVIASDDLQVGAIGREVGTTASYNGITITSSTTINIDHYTVKFNNQLTEPTYWGTLSNYDYGSFSITKFQFMLKNLGSEILNSANDWSYNQTLNYRIKLNNALLEYEATNGPLIDENGKAVKFS